MELQFHYQCNLFMIPPSLSPSAGAAAPLLQDVSLHLPANSLGLVYGRSGAGKTTLLNLVAGLAQPTAGEICIAKDDSNVAAGVGSLQTLALYLCQRIEISIFGWRILSQ